MNKQQILNKLKDCTLDATERESLNQHLHYLTVEGIKPTSAKRSRKKKNTHVRKNFKPD